MKAEIDVNMDGNITHKEFIQMFADTMNKNRSDITLNEIFYYEEFHNKKK